MRASRSSRWRARRAYAPEECLPTYGHTFEEFDPADRTPAAEAIHRARAEVLGPNLRSLYARRPRPKPQSRIWLYN